MRPAALFLLAAVSGLGATAIRDVTIVDAVNGSLAPHMTVVWEGERISRIGPSATLYLSRDTTIIEGAGKFLIPGLWDMHVHLAVTNDNPLPKFLDWGVTGVRDMGSDYARVVAWRDAIEKGRAPGPHVIATGPPVDRLATPDEARQAFDKLYEMDVDFVNVSGGVSRDAYFALAEEARHERKPVAGEIPGTVTVT